MTDVEQQLARAAKLATGGDGPGAIKAYRAILRRRKDNAAAHRGLGLAHLSAGDGTAAVKHLAAAARLAPCDPEVRFILGNVHLALGAAEAAASAYQEAISLNSTVPEVHSNLGAALHQAGRSEDAIRAVQEALRLRPRFAEAHNTLGIIFADQGEAERAADQFARALASEPKLLGAIVNQGHALRDLGRLDEARARFTEAIAVDGRSAPAHNGLGLVLRAENRQAEAAAEFETACALDNGSPEALNNLAITYQAQGRHGDALKLCRDVVAAHPKLAAAHLNLGHILQSLGRHDEALAAFEAAIAIDANLHGAFPFLAHSLMYLCRWNGLGDVVDKVLALAQTDDPRGPVVPPFALAGTEASPALRLKVARRSAAAAAANVAGLKSGQAFTYHRQDRPRLRVGYVSPDFRQHSVAVAFKGLFDARNRDAFEWFGYSLNTADGDEVASAFESEFDSFTDVSAMALRGAAERINGDGIDLLVDLAGHTRDSRPEIFALEPAPVQAHYLGYGSTVGADFIQWLITDPVHTPPALAPNCSEALVYLPDSFMAATRAVISDGPVTRAACGLPDDGFVFVDFNAHYKFHPGAFEVWMGLLRDIPGGVLWLRDGAPTAMENLRSQAERHGVDAARLVFAPRAEHAEHLARHRLADLALDTQFHSGGVTTIDALWAGVPVVTIAGAAHSARTGASILSAMEMPELICADLGAYETLARDLARDGARLAALRGKLAAKRDSAPLFDVARLARHLEAAYRLMWENWRDGHAPRPIHVPASDA